MTRISRTVRRQRVQARIATSIWATVALVSLGAATLTALTDRGMERVAGLINPVAPGFAARVSARVEGAEIAELSAQLARLRSEVKLLALENEALATRITRIDTDAANPIATASLPAADQREAPDSQPRQVYPPIPFSQRDMAIEVTTNGVDADLEQLASAEAREAETVTVATRFALEIGSGADLAELNALWEALAERHDALLGGLEPKFGVMSSDSGESRLLLRAGPIANAADAIAACTALRQRGTACSPVSDMGELLVMQ